MKEVNIITTRKSIRSFTDQPIDPETLIEIVKLAQRAPSYENSQPWKVYIAVGETARQLREKHYELNRNEKSSYAEITPPSATVWDAFPQKNINTFIDSLNELGHDRMKEFWDFNYRLYNAPALVYLTVPENTTAYSMYDMGAFGYGLTLAAKEFKIDSIIAYEFIRFPNEIRSHFDISEQEKLLMGIGLGYASEDRVNEITADRAPLEHVLQIKD